MEAKKRDDAGGGYMVGIGVSLMFVGKDDI